MSANVPTVETGRQTGLQQIDSELMAAMRESARPGAPIIEKDEDFICPVTEVSQPRDLNEFMRRIIFEAHRGPGLATPRQIALAFMAACYAQQLPCMAAYTLEATSQSLGCSYTLFHRLVKRWATAFGVPMPHAKPRRNAEV
jgi:AraC-like DNA-binding protein